MANFSSFAILVLQTGPERVCKMMQIAILSSNLWGRKQKTRREPSGYKIQMVVYPDYKPVAANTAQLFRLFLAQVTSFNWQFSNFLLAIIS